MGGAALRKQALEARPAIADGFQQPNTGIPGRDAEHNRMFVQRGQEHKNSKLSFSESLILAQNERWQRGLGMQVGRDREDSNIGP